jgi:hypothetical protein
MKKPPKHREAFANHVNIRKWISPLLEPHVRRME